MARCQKKSGLKEAKTRSRQLRRDINRLAKELNIEPIDLETQWASAIEKVSQLKNQIEDLNQQIAKGEKRKSRANFHKARC
jgi:flagellar hook-associated protein FlgK